MPVSSAFDIMANTYDKDFTYTAIGQLQRERVWKFLTPLLSSYQRPLNILELNCGTGEDALQLASMGHHVLATDASAAMIEKAKEKLYHHHKYSAAVEFVKCSFADIPLYFNHQKFDIVLSNFGGLNCVAGKELEQLSNSLSQVTHQNSKLFFVIMSSCCLWEMFYYTLKGNFKKALRRQQKSVPFGKGENRMNIYYYQPGRIRKLFASHFIKEQVYPIGFTIPPSYLEGYFKKKPSLLNRLRAWENGWGNNPLLSGLSDHFCITLKKNAE